MADENNNKKGWASCAILIAEVHMLNTEGFTCLIRALERILTLAIIFSFIRFCT